MSHREPVTTPEEPTIGKLVVDASRDVSSLIKHEIELAKSELKVSVRAGGIGIGLFAGAAVFGYFGALALLATVILVLSVWLWPWLAALIVTVLLFVAAGILALIGVRRLQRGVPPVPQSSIDSVKSDVQAFKGVGNYDR